MLNRVFQMHLVLGLALAFALVLGCAGTSRVSPGAPDLAPLRLEGRTSSNPEVVGRWLLTELLSPTGSLQSAAEARKRLLGLDNRGMYGRLALALDASVHGRVQAAASGFIDAFQAARESDSNVAPLVAWFALREAVILRRDSKDLYQRHRKLLDEAILQPGNIGWRARIQLVSWKAAEDRANAQGRATHAAAAKAQGCAPQLRLWGPFGTGQRADIVSPFSPETARPLPAFFPREFGAAQSPRLLKTDTSGCVTFADEGVADGVFYAETFVNVAQTSDVVLAVEGAYAVWLDDVLVQSRDPRTWAAWPRWGVALRLTAGRHRVLAKLQRASTAFRLMHPNGTPLAFQTSVSASAPYTLDRPKILPDPNLLSRFTTDRSVLDPGDAIVRFLAADTANSEGQGDLAMLLIEPLIKDRKVATGVALLRASAFANSDPLVGGSMGNDLVRNLEQHALKRDPGLWAPRLSRALMEGEQQGTVEAVGQLKKLVAEFPDVSAIWSALQRSYGVLGWTTEQAALVKQMVKHFPDHPEVLAAAVDVYQEEGDLKQTEQLVARIATLDRNSEIKLSRALERQNYGLAVAELERLKRLHPDRKELASRLYDLKLHTGEVSETTPKLAADIRRDPQDGAARLALADAQLSNNQPEALTRAVIEATLAGANSGQILDAIDLTQGKSELEPYRLDALAVIRDYEKQAQHQPGTAARVLDYSALWVRSDGSARMLEHEVVRLQSTEAIQQFAESAKLDGLVLHMRVIKQSGQILEPESVQGKPTVTFPHLEVGDYVETEHISTVPSQDRMGDRYLGPRWFFREKNIAYARSEFLVISPKNRPLMLETRGQVPSPEVLDLGEAVLRRWRVDRSPAAPSEPFQPPADEFLPSVYVGWGISLERRLSDLGRELASMFPVDPRIRAIAEGIASPARGRSERDQAQALYRWVLDNVQAGEATDGRQVIITKEGNPWRAFMELCRALDIQVDFALVKNRLAAAPQGALSEAAAFSDPALRLMTKHGETWLWLNSKYAPFGFLPDEDRGMPAYLVTAAGPVKATTAAAGPAGGIAYLGSGELRRDGSASLELQVHYQGVNAISIREAIAAVPEARLRATLESELFGQLIDGAKLKSFKILNLARFNEPLTFVVKLEVPHFASVQGRAVSIVPPFTSGLARYAGLGSRQTPLIIEQEIALVVDVTLKLPPIMGAVGISSAQNLSDGLRRISISDRADASVLHLSRKVTARADRILPKEYHQFQRFAAAGDAALGASIHFELAE